MVLSPSDINRPKIKDDSETRQLEKIIDETLLKGERAIAMSFFPNEAVKQRIVSRYEAVGWHIEHHYDSRCGGYLQFLEHEPLYDGGCGGWRE